MRRAGITYYKGEIPHPGYPNDRTLAPLQVEMHINLNAPTNLAKLIDDAWANPPDPPQPPTEDGEVLLSGGRTSVPKPKLPAIYRHPALGLKTNAQ